MSILSDEVRSILNMVPSNKEDMKYMSFDINSYDPLQPLEILGRQCLADFYLHDSE